MPHQSSAEDVIQVTSLPETDNINEITDCISEGAEPTYQIPKMTNRGKPPVHYEADINAKGKYPINNYVSLTRLSESRKNGIWELVPLPHGKKTVGCKWIYTVKLKADGSVERYKARLVAKGYTHRYGIYYQETFAPVAKIKTIRILLSLAANLDWPLHQFDVKNAFLHGDLEEEVYMDLPSGCNFTRDKGNQVCKLKKSLYGLKQSPRAWFGRFTKSMKFFGYTQSNADHTLFLKRDGKKLTALIVYVDDIVVTGNDTGEQLKLQKYLSQEFEMKDLGDLKYFLGIEVARSANGICLSQRKYVLDLLAETGLLGCKPADTPIEMNHKLCECMDQEPTNKEQYQRLVGRNAVDRILRYLKLAPGKGLMFSKNRDLEVVGYTDADWAGSITDRRSTSGYFTFVGGNLVTWRSKKQNVVSRSSAEAEYRGMAHGICELLWIRRLLTELGFKPGKPMELHCDNKSAIDIAHNPVQHDRTKHVEVDRHFIKEKIEKKIIHLPFVKSEDQLADILTKAVCSRVFYDSLTKLGIGDVYAPT
ncbi:unnamed protein product [Prunus brigantina]